MPPLTLALGLQFARNMATLLKGSANHGMLLAMSYAMGILAFWQENNRTQALVCINGVCNSCRDETWKPHYQALRFFLVRLHERKEHPRRLQVAAQGDQRGVLAAAPRQARSRRPHARKGI